MTDPGPVAGSSPFANWCERLRIWMRSLQLVSGVGYKVRRTTTGTILEILPGAGGSSSLLKMHRIKDVAGDYVIARTFDGTTEGTDDVNIAKPFELRESNLSTALYSIADPTSVMWQADFSYGDSDFDANRRQVAIDHTSTVTELNRETRYVEPIWEPDVSVIWAAQCDHTGVLVGEVELTLLDINAAGRVWAKEYAPPA